MAQAWVAQRKEQVSKMGKRQAPHYTFWTLPGGQVRKKSFGPGPEGKKLAEIHAATLNADLKMGRMPKSAEAGLTWEQFVAKYDGEHLKGISVRTRESVLPILQRFGCEMKINGSPVNVVDTSMARKFVGIRRQARGKKRGSTLAADSINIELRSLRAALRWAAEGGLIEKAPTIQELKANRTLKRYVNDDDFRDIFSACTAATRPGPTPGLWWQALLGMLACTGRRISETLSLRWADVDVANSVALTRAEANKGGRDDFCHVHPAAMDRMVALRQTDDPQERVFSWDDELRALYDEFRIVQKAAGINLKCIIRQEHEHTDACHSYAFHDLRRRFATVNSGRLSKDELQRLMRHKSQSTTQGYIVFAESVRPIAPNIDVPAPLTLPLQS